MNQVRIPYTSQKFCEMLKSVSERAKKRVGENHYLSPNLIFSNELNASSNVFVKNLPVYFFADNILNYPIQPNRIVTDISPAPLLNKRIDIKVKFYYRTRESAAVPLTNAIEMILMCRFVVNGNGRGEFLIYDYPVSDSKMAGIKTAKTGVLKDMGNGRSTLNNTAASQTISNTQNSELLSTSNKLALGGMAASGLSEFDGSFRVTNGIKNQFSPKYYDSGWNGGSVARIKTYSLGNTASVMKGVSFGASVITTGMSYRDLWKGEGDMITYADASVGSAGILTYAAEYFTGVEIPVVGEFVALYGVLRLTWDVFFYLGETKGISTWIGDDDTKWFK